MSIPFAPQSMEFGLGDNADAIRDTTARWAADRLAPLAAEIDEKNAFKRELWPEMGELGLHGITVEEEFGGLGLGYLEHVVAMEEVSRASASIGLALVGAIADATSRQTAILVTAVFPLVAGLLAALLPRPRGPALP